MRRHFHKMHGLGNDFVIVDARPESGNAPFDVTPALAKAIADRRTGVGCDQLIVLEPSDTADLKMRIWNADGGEVSACGNATRCVVQLTGARRIACRVWRTASLVTAQLFTTTQSSSAGAVRAIVSASAKLSRQPSVIVSMLMPAPRGRARPRTHGSRCRACGSAGPAPS